MNSLDQSTVAELLGEFRNACLEQYDAILAEDVGKHKRIFDSLLAITRELKRRGAEERRSLLTLFEDNNPQVRLQAANFVIP